MSVRRRFSKKRKMNKRGKRQEESMIGKIIDLSLEDFKEELVRQKVNIGTINNLILNLESVYYELRMRKEGVMNLVFTGVRNKEDPLIKKSLDGLYSEMIKVEQKITYLKERHSELVDVDKTPN